MSFMFQDHFCRPNFIILINWFSIKIKVPVCLPFKIPHCNDHIYFDYKLWQKSKNTQKQVIYNHN